MAQKKTNSKKPLIILCVVVIVAVLAFLIYDEVQSSNYLNHLRLPRGGDTGQRQHRNQTRHLSARR